MRKAMPFDFKSLQKLETPSPSAIAKGMQARERVVVVIKTKEGAKMPSYVNVRSKISAQIFSGEMTAVDLPRLQADPSIESVALSQQLPLIK
jgi:hypothetical protein